jgi:hypothetical protein
MATSPEDFWPGFGEDDGPDEVECGSGGSLAQAVMNSYGIACSDGTGGSLPNLDIKHMDAMQVVKLSLLEESADNDGLYEPMVNNSGNVEFRKIGSGQGPSDIYYEIQSSTYKEDCSGVLVIGNNPMPVRRSISWKSIWDGGDVKAYATGKMYSSCAQGDFNQHAVKVYDDPHLNTSYADGIDNVYEISEGNAWDSVIGYARYITWDGWETDSDAVVNKSDTAKILVKTALSLGNVLRRPVNDPGPNNNADCYDGVGEEVPYGDGVDVPIPAEFRFDSVRGTTVDKFSGISTVYVVGRGIEDMRGVPKTNADSANPSEGATDIWIKVTDTFDQVFTLERGKHFQIAYEPGGSSPSPQIVFADNHRKNDPLVIPDGGLVTFFIDPDCGYAISDNAGENTGEALLLPTGQTKGIIVKEIWAGVELDTPSITVFHPDGVNNRAMEIAESLDYQVAPLVTTDEPAPIGFNGGLIDQISGKVDHDPTTAQSLSETPLEQAYTVMDAGGGMTLTLSFLDVAQVQKLSGALYGYMNSGSGTEATYVCGPNCNAELGASAGSGGVVNSIVYSYQDSNSYTVSVNVGPYLVGGAMAQVDGGPALKITEEVSAKGTILQDSGNNIYYKVHVDGIGDRIAVNMIPAVLRTGDKVTVGIHNNPVES